MLDSTPATLVACFAGLVVLCVQASARLGTPAPTASQRFHLDINSARWEELVIVEGVGDTLAMRIVEDRDQNGPYEGVDDLRRVRGIGAISLEKMRPWLTARAANSATQ